MRRDRRENKDKLDIIARKHGNVSVLVLRQIYGASFAKDFGSEQKLGDLIGVLDEISRVKLLADHENGTLPTKIAVPCP